LQKKISKRLKLPQARVDKDVVDALLHYVWPGNVRELENVVERMIHSVEGGVLTTAQLPAEISRASAAPAPIDVSHATLHHDSHSLKQAVAEQERRLLVDLLKRYHGNISLIARDMAVSRNTIYRKIHHYGISRDYSFD
jgi:DNA-binding NtrC family response regulator